MIRVLHVVGSMNRGGIETFIMNVYRNIDRTKVQFDFAVHSTKVSAYDEEIKSLGGKIYYITPRTKNIFQHYRDWIKLFKHKKQIEIIHQHVSSLTYVNPLKIASWFNIKTRIVHAHSTEAESKIHFLLHKFNSKMIHKYANTYFSCSDKASNWLFQDSKINTNDITIIKNGINLISFKYDNKIRRNLREKLNLNENFVIGHVGRFSNVKNHKFVIDIFSDFNSKVNKSKLLLIGTGELEYEVKEYVKIKGLGSDVIFLGSIPNVGEYMQVMDSFVFPSLYEGLGMVLVEAQASGLTCFTSEGVVPTEANVTGRINYLPLELGAESWSENIINKVYNKSPKRDQVFKKELSQYDIKDVAFRLQEYYLTKSNLI
ncbi:glycosyltransferase family 1 protein [Terribacillus saccharophilus]|uniref:glycosyltransferase family 1 protein n=1 Tax=Terribacillus saccharophilus TaxID=361277 RepID=UPI003982114C